MAKQVWRHKPTGDLYTVVEEEGRIVQSMGPFDEADARTVDLVEGPYLAKVAELAAETPQGQQQRDWIDASRDEFEPYPA